VLLLVLAFGMSIGQAYAATGCFIDTNGNWAETYICWLKDNGITTGVGGGYYDPNGYVTRAQMAVFLQRLAEIPPSTGDIYINAGLNDWEVNGTSSAYINRFTSFIGLGAPGAGTYGFQITPDLPATLYGKQMYTHSVKICYDATHGASITGVTFEHFYWNGTGSEIYRIVSDTTDRTDAACREYTFPTDGALFGSDHVAVYLTAHFTSSADYASIQSTTFTLVPSANAGTLSQQDTNEIRTDMQSLEPVPGGAEAAP
jgi:hypothetical protein